MDQRCRQRVDAVEHGALDSLALPLLAELSQVVLDFALQTRVIVEHLLHLRLEVDRDDLQVGHQIAQQHRPLLLQLHLQREQQRKDLLQHRSLLQLHLTSPSESDLAEHRLLGLQHFCGQILVVSACATAHFELLRAEDGEGVAHEIQLGRLQIVAELSHLVVVHQRTQDVLTELAGHLELGFVVQLLQDDSVDALAGTRGEEMRETT